MDVSGKTICITGVGGFIGLRMAERARERGMTVRGIELSSEACARARGAGVDVVAGDLCDPAAACAALEGSDVVFHTAAVVSEDASWALSRKVNVDGTMRLAQSARALGVRRFVHLSSVMVYGFDYPDQVTEEGPLDGACNPYCQTKLESDQVALAMHDPGRLEVTVIRPGDVYGPGCPSWVVRPIELMKQGMFAHIDAGRGVLNLVHVDNLLDGVFAALARDAVGSAFNITDGATTSCRDFFGHFQRWLGRSFVPSLPAALALPAFATIERAFSQLGKPPPVHSAAIRFVARRHAYSIAKARRELGYAPRIGLSEGMAALERWARATALV